MKRNNKKGFTIVELVIVIAVIAILSAVLIPTFGGIIEKANESARDQEAANLYKEYLAEWDYVEDGEPTTTGVIIVDGHKYTVTNGELDVNIDNPEATEAEAANGAHFLCNNDSCTH